MKKLLIVCGVLLTTQLHAFSYGDTLSFTIGNTQIRGVIENIQGDTITLDGDVINQNFGLLHVEDLKLSLDAFSSGSLLIYDYGSVYLEGNQTVEIGGVRVSNLRLYLDQTGFWANGDIDFQGVFITLKFIMGADGFVSGDAYIPEISVRNVTLTDLYLHLSNEGIEGSGHLDMAGNSLTMKLRYENSQIYGEIEKCNVTINDILIKDFKARLDENGFWGRGKIYALGNYMDIGFVAAANNRLTIYDGTLTVHGVEITNIRGTISDITFSLGGHIDIYGTTIGILFYASDLEPPPRSDTISTKGYKIILAEITSKQITIGNVLIEDLDLYFDSNKGLYGTGKVFVNNLSWPQDGKITVYFSTDLNGFVSIGLQDGHVVLSDGKEIDNLNAYIDSYGFWGEGTYVDGENDVAVYFRSDAGGSIYWSISGSSITIGNIILHHYYVDSHGNAHAWWIVSPTDSIYFDISADGRSATVHTPTQFNFGGLIVYDFTGTIYSYPEWGFEGSGYVIIGNEQYSITVPIAFTTTPQGKLMGTLPEYLTVQDLYGVTINIYGIKVTITEEGIYGEGHFAVEGMEADVIFYATQDGNLNASIENGYMELGSLYLTDFNFSLYPFYVYGTIVIPDIEGGVSFVLKGDGNGNVSLSIPGFNFVVDGFQVSGYMEYYNGKLVMAGSVTLPDGGTGSIDYLAFTSQGIDSCSITFTNITISEFTLVSGRGIFARDPDRIILSATFDLSQSGFVDTVYFDNLVISPNGDILYCQSIGVENLNIGGFLLSGNLELTRDYIVIHSAQVDMSAINAGTVTVVEMVFTREGDFVSVSAFGIENVNVGIFHGWGWAYFIDSGIRIDGRVNLDNIGYFYAKGLVIDNSGNIISMIDGAANVQIGDYGFYGRLSLPQENRIYIEGEIRLPQFINGEAGGSILLEKVEDGEGVLGLGYNVLAGSVSIPSFDIADYTFSYGSFAFDSVGMKGEAEVDVPNIAGFYLTFFIEWDGTFHYAEVATQGLNIPLGQAGLFLTGAGGGLYYYETQDVWEIILIGTVEDVTHTLSLISTLEIYTDGRISGVGHLAVEHYVYGSAGFDIDIPASEITASAWIGEDPDEGISYWGCYIKGLTSVYYNWNNVEATGSGNVEISIWFIELGGDMGFAYNTIYPYVYGPYYMERLYTDGLGAAAILNEYLYGINIQWNGDGFDFDVWSGSMGDSPGNAPYIHDFVIVGPYPDDGIDYDYLGGEDKISPYDGYESPGGKVWLGVQTDSTGFLNLNQYFNNVSAGIVYLGLFINYEDTLPVYMRYGIAGEYKVFLNGNEIVTGQYTYAEPDRNTTPLELDHGWNKLLIKVRKISSDWGMYLRLTDVNGNEIPFLTTQPDNPEHVVEFHDRCYTFDASRWERTGYVMVENGALTLESRGTYLYSTILRDKKDYPHSDFPSIKCQFMLTGIASNDSTIIGVEGYTDDGEYRYFGVLFYYPGKGDSLVAIIEGQEKSAAKDININEWYTLEFRVEPEVINCYLYRAGETRPVKPLFVDSTYNWNPSFFATVGGDDNKLYLDNIVVKRDWLTDYNVRITTPHPYPNNTTMEWYIENDQASAIRIHFSDFAIETGFDSLIIKDENDVVWGVYTGNLGRFTSDMIPGKKAHLILKTDPSGQDYGFSIDYVQYYVDYPYTYSHPVNISTPHPYQNNYTESWEITLPGAKSIKLYFSNFHVEEEHDYVNIYDVHNHLYASYSGDLGNFASIAIPGDYVKIELVSDNAVTDYGFDLRKITYTTADWTGIEENHDSLPSVSGLSLVIPDNIIKNNLRLRIVLDRRIAPVIELYNIAGRKLIELKPGILNPGVYDFNLPLNKNSEGIYFLRVKMGNKVVSRKIIKIR